MLFILAREGMQEAGGQSACPSVRTSNTASVNGQAAHSQQPWPRPFPHRTRTQASELGRYSEAS